MDTVTGYRQQLRFSVDLYAVHSDSKFHHFSDVLYGVTANSNSKFSSRGGTWPSEAPVKVYLEIAVTREKKTINYYSACCKLYWTLNLQSKPL